MKKDFYQLCTLAFISPLFSRLLIVLHVLLLHGLLLPLLLRDGRRPLLRLPPPVTVVVERGVEH